MSGYYVLEKGEKLVGHVRLIQEMETFPKGERLRHMIRWNVSLPPLTKAYAIKMKKGYKLVHIASIRNTKRTFETKKEMMDFLDKIKARMYPIPQEGKKHENSAIRSS